MLLNTEEYIKIITKIKAQIREAQYRAVLSANSEMIKLYWNIGNTINEKSAWGNKFIENLSRDIKYDFPDSTGYSVRNLKYMAKFAQTYPEGFQIVQRGVAQLPWRHNIVLMEKIKDKKQREWYLAKAIENGWTRDILVHQIETDLYHRQAKAKKITNFKKVLPKPQSELAVQTIKDPYIFDFIAAKEKMLERQIESELVKKITKLLLELGTGFAFIGNQYHLEISGKDFYIDLLFYNLALRCYVVIELKSGDFESEYAGKLNFYLSAVDDILKTEQDNPSIGILLCRTKDDLIAEYALKDMTKPIGVSEYKILDKLPKKYKDALPSVDDIKTRILGE
ncbi:MAG: PDDEXK nuclease domain-containing protein [Treponema sp.]|jgi:predicted nuclease of restriction endonuclease-like (RecB) superfamily|nr:PDDEXK nuclease domain-containing protein [Treponema sp.]